MYIVHIVPIVTSFRLEDEDDLCPSNENNLIQKIDHPSTVSSYIKHSKYSLLKGIEARDFSLGFYSTLLFEVRIAEKLKVKLIKLTESNEDFFGLKQGPLE